MRMPCFCAALLCVLPLPAFARGGQPDPRHVDRSEHWQRTGENVRVLVDTAVGDDGLSERGHAPVLRGPVPQKKDLQMEAPGPHISVEIRQIGIIDHRFVGHLPAQPLPQPLGQRGLACTDITGDENEILCHGYLRQ